MEKLKKYKQYESKLKRVGQTQQQAFVYAKHKKGKIDNAEVKNIYDEWSKKAEKEKGRFIIRGISSLGLFTLKGLRTPLDLKSEEEYLEGRVKDTDKFEWFSGIEVTYLTDIKPKKQDLFGKPKKVSKK